MSRINMGDLAGWFEKMTGCIPKDVEATEAQYFVMMVRTFGRFLSKSYPGVVSNVTIGEGWTGNEHDYRAFQMGAIQGTGACFPPEDDPNADAFKEFMQGLLSILPALCAKADVLDLALGLTTLGERMEDKPPES